MLTYEESATLMRDATFISRIKVACLTYANYIFGEPTTTPAHNTRLRWAQSTLSAPDVAASFCAPTMDPAVQSAGASISDADLQSATENALNKLL